jgi:uncharacterized membrane protein YccC
MAVCGALFFGVAYVTLTVFPDKNPRHAPLVLFVATIIGCILGIAFGATFGAQVRARLHRGK